MHLELTRLKTDRAWLVLKKYLGVRKIRLLETLAGLDPNSNPTELARKQGQIIELDHVLSGLLDEAIEWAKKKEQEV